MLFSPLDRGRDSSHPWSRLFCVTMPDCSNVQISHLRRAQPPQSSQRNLSRFAQTGDDLDVAESTATVGGTGERHLRFSKRNYLRRCLPPLRTNKYWQCALGRPALLLRSFPAAKCLRRKSISYRGICPQAAARKVWLAAPEPVLHVTSFCDSPFDPFLRCTDSWRWRGWVDVRD